MLIFYDTGISEGMPGYALARRITKASGFEVASLSYLLLTFGHSFYEKAMEEWFPKKAPKKKWFPKQTTSHLLCLQRLPEWRCRLKQPGGV